MLTSKFLYQKCTSILNILLKLGIMGFLFLVSCTSEPDNFYLEDAARSSLDQLYIAVDNDRQILDNAAAILVIPKITSASFVVGGSYGEGILFIKDAAVEHYSVATASYGVDFGASRFSQALVFMTSNALKEFRTTDGWELSADASYVYRNQGKNLGVSSNTLQSPVFEIIYNQNGLSLGASLKGAKYSRLIR